MKFRSRLFTALIRVPSTAINSRPNRSRLRHTFTKPRNPCRNASRFSRRKSARVLKFGRRRRNSQITSRLRWVSASSRRLDRTRFRYPSMCSFSKSEGSYPGRRRLFRLRSFEPGPSQVETVDESLDEPHWVVGIHRVVYRVKLSRV